mmetsp:Transcript_135594/g.377627  ORF Transcript_135594/g.377627 Transcript_135594/m.377627 type:complete len:529 (+) Transcript_135594:77-1663(+)
MESVQLPVTFSALWLSPPFSPYAPHSSGPYSADKMVADDSTFWSSLPTVNAVIDICIPTGEACTVSRVVWAGRNGAANPRSMVLVAVRESHEITLHTWQGTSKCNEKQECIIPAATIRASQWRLTIQDTHGSAQAQLRYLALFGVTEAAVRRRLADNSEVITAALRTERELQAMLAAEATALQVPGRYQFQGNFYWERLCRDADGKRLPPEKLHEVSQTFAVEAEDRRIDPADGQPYTKSQFEDKYGDCAVRELKKKWEQCKPCIHSFIFSACGHPPTRWSALMIGLRKSGIPSAALFEETFTNWEIHFGAAVSRLLDEGFTPIILFDDEPVKAAGDYTEDALGKAQRGELNWWQSVAQKDRYKDKKIQRATFADFFYDKLGYREVLDAMMQEMKEPQADDELRKVADSSPTELAELLHLATMLYEFSDKGKEFIEAVKSFKDRCCAVPERLHSDERTYQQIIEKNEDRIKYHKEQIEELSKYHNERIEKHKEVIAKYHEKIDTTSRQADEWVKLGERLNEVFDRATS